MLRKAKIQASKKYETRQTSRCRFSICLTRNFSQSKEIYLHCIRYYDGFEKPAELRYGLPNLNYLVTPLQFTMRKVKLEENIDNYSK